MSSAGLMAIFGFAAVILAAAAYAHGLIFNRTGFRWVHTLALAAGAVALAQLSAVLMEAQAETARGLMIAQSLLTISVVAQAVTILRARRRRAPEEAALPSAERPS